MRRSTVILKNFSVWHFHSLQLEEKMEVKYYSAGVEMRERQRIEKEKTQYSSYILY